MRLQLFKHTIPEKLITQTPPKTRSEARLMVLHRDTGLIEHKMFSDIADYFDAGDIIIANDSYKMNNIIYGEKDDTKITILLLKTVDDTGLAWDAMVSPSRKVRVGNRIYFKDLNMDCYVEDNTSIRGRILRFNTHLTGEEFFNLIQEKAFIDLPEYIKHTSTNEDKNFLKSVYAKYPNSIDFVVSGLHFTQKQLLELQLKKINFETLTYIVTNFPENKFNTKTISLGKRIPEFCKISDDVINKINIANDNHKKICAVGYSSALGIENYFSRSLGRMIKTKEIVNKVLITQSDFCICNALLTNFHANGSMFLIVDAAFCGIDLLKNAYNAAIKEKYDFFIFGDSLLII